MRKPKETVVKKKARNDTSYKGKGVVKKKISRAGIPKEGVHLGIRYDSHIEYYMLCWLEELRLKGIVKAIYRSPTFVLTEGYKNEYTIPTKKGDKTIKKSQVLLRPSEYTPEFLVVWKKPNDYVWLADSGTKCDKPLVGTLGEGNTLITYIECKPDMDRNNMTRLFISNQKFLFNKSGVFVNLMKPNEFFSRTFCPQAYLQTPTGLERKLKFIPKLLKNDNAI